MGLRTATLALSAALLLAAPAGALAPADAACVVEGVKRTAALSRVAGKEQLRCLKRFAAGKETDLGACRFLDGRERVAKARQKSERGEAKKCPAVPSFGWAGSGVASDVALAASWTLIGDLLEASGDQAARCRHELLKGSHALLDTVWKETARAGKRSAGGSASAADLASAIGAFLGASPKLAKRSSSLAKRLARRCGGDGSLGTLGDQKARCGACRAVNGASSLQVDCEILDDGAANDSCPFELPPAITVDLDEAARASALVGPEGGAVSAAAADGTVYTLDVPPGALARAVEIGLVPAAIPDLPLGAFTAAVQFEPDGLRFWGLGGATLTVDLPQPPTGPLVGFGWEGSGEGLHLRPRTLEGSTLTFAIEHFSGVGVAEDDDPGDGASWFHSIYERDFSDTLGEVFDGLDPEFDPSDPAFREPLLEALRRWYRNAIRPRLYQAFEAPTLYERGASEALSFLGAQASLGLLQDGLWGTSGDPLHAENQQILDLLQEGFRFKVDYIVDLCLEDENAEAFLNAATDHEVINAALVLLDPPPTVHGSLLAFFEGRCIEVGILEVDYPEELGPGDFDDIQIWTGWWGPSGAVHHDAFPVHVQASSPAALLDPPFAAASPVDGTHTISIAMQSEDGTTVTLEPSLQAALMGAPVTLEIGGEEEQCPRDSGGAWPEAFVGTWDVTAIWSSFTCEAGSECSHQSGTSSEVWTLGCDEGIAEFWNLCPTCDLQLTSLSTTAQSISVSGGSAVANLMADLQVTGDELTGSYDFEHSDVNGSGETSVSYTATRRP